MALIDKLTDIANAIRSKTGSSNSLTLDAMPAAINSIKTGEGGGTTDNSLLYSILDGSVTNVTANDLSGITSLKQYTFYNCANLKTVTLPASITKMDHGVFVSCHALESVRFLSKPTMAYDVFFSNSKLKNIYVPWGEGEVADAPWGAAGVTIHYNS